MLLARTGTFASKVATPVVTVTGDIAMSPMTVAGVIEDVLPIDITGDIAMSPMTVAGVIEDVLPIDITGDIAMSPMTVAGVLAEPVTVEGAIEMGAMTVAGVLTEQDTLLDGLISWYELDEASGTRADSHTNSLNLSQAGTVGISGGGADFDGNSANHLFSDAANYNFGDTTFYIAAFVNIDDTVPGRGGTILSRDNFSANQQQFILFTSLSTPRFTVSPNGTAASGVAAVASSALTPGTWHLVEAYHNATTNQIGIAVDGGTFVTTAHSSGVFSATVRFQVGRRVASTSNYPIDAQIKQITIHNRMLETAERVALYNSGSGIAYPG